MSKGGNPNDKRDFKNINNNNLKIKERKKIMAKTPVTMKIDGYKDREVLMVTRIVKF